MEYIELNMSNYDEADVSQLNEWGIAAFAAIEDLTKEAAFVALPEHTQAALLQLVGHVPEPSADKASGTDTLRFIQIAVAANDVEEFQYGLDVHGQMWCWRNNFSRWSRMPMKPEDERPAENPVEP